ncbi:MAG: dTMP kinase [Solobacterium sp.]|nr:dTMP kinase [Solobacterium sp.]
MKKGLFITFEGPDGSGKSSVSKAVCARLQEEGYPVIYTREPGGIGSDIAEKIRSLILDVNNQAMDAKTEALLFAAGRRQHLIDVILPALEEGKVIISDRYIDSSMAYQGYGRGLGREAVMEINQFAIENCMPDKTIFFRVEASTGLARLKLRERADDRLDQEKLDFHERVFNGYMEILDVYRNRMIEIDANLELDEVIENTYTVVKGLIDAQRDA